MAESRKTNTSNITSFGNSQVQRQHADVHRIVDSRENLFFELEPVQVDEVLLDKNKLPKKSNGKPDYKYYGAIKGRWCNEKNQPILGNGIHILPLDPYLKRYPVVGENVVCVNYFNQTYYTNIINIKNSPNENIKTGTADTLNTRVSIQTTDEDNTYKRNIEANRGDLVLTGRYGSSIKIGENDLVPSVQIVAGHNTDGLEINEPVKNNLNKDDASIYVQGKGGSLNVKNPNKELSDIYSKGSVIVLDADYIVLNAKQVLKQQSGELNELIGKNVEVKHNQKEGTIFTGKTKKLLDNIRSRPVKIIKAEIDKCIEEIRKLTTIEQHEFEELKQLKEKLSNLKLPNPMETLRNVTKTSPTLKTDEYVKLQNELIKAQSELSKATPNIATDPVSYGLALTKVVNLVNEIARLKFLRQDIITD